MARGTRFNKGVKDLYSFASQEAGRKGSIAYGTVAITGSRDINTGLTTVVSGSANVANVARSLTKVTGNQPVFCICRISKPSGTQVGASKGTGYMKILCMTTGSVEATSAASVDWFAIGDA